MSKKWMFTSQTEKGTVPNMKKKTPCVHQPKLLDSLRKDCQVQRAPVRLRQHRLGRCQGRLCFLRIYPAYSSLGEGDFSNKNGGTGGTMGLNHQTKGLNMTSPVNDGLMAVMGLSGNGALDHFRPIATHDSMIFHDSYMVNSWLIL